MNIFSRIAVLSVLLLIGCELKDADTFNLRSPTATLKYAIRSCELVEIEVALVEALQAFDVESFVLDERFKDVNPPDVVTVIGESDGFDVNASNFAEREVLSIAIYQDGDDPRDALTFAKKLSDLLSNVMPCAERLGTMDAGGKLEEIRGRTEITPSGSR